jgi:hypothetical protein
MGVLAEAIVEQVISFSCDFHISWRKRVVVCACRVKAALLCLVRQCRTWGSVFEERWEKILLAWGPWILLVTVLRSWRLSTKGLMAPSGKLVTTTEARLYLKLWI